MKKTMAKRIWCFETLDDRRCMAVASAGWDGPGKGSADLTYFVANAPSGLSKADVTAAIKTALDAWSRIASVHFTESKNPGLAKQLDISFGRIDGSGGTLAFEASKVIKLGSSRCSMKRIDLLTPWRIRGVAPGRRRFRTTPKQLLRFANATSSGPSPRVPNRLLSCKKWRIRSERRVRSQFQIRGCPRSMEERRSQMTTWQMPSSTYRSCSGSLTSRDGNYQIPADGACSLMVLGLRSIH